MFGMLDYRAFQLYRLIFGIPRFAITLTSLVGVSFLIYAISVYCWRDYFDLSDRLYLLWLIVIPVTLIVEIIWLIVVTYVVKFFDFLFGILIDVIPHEGRNEAEAQFVLKTGKKGARQLLLDKTNPRDWTDDMINYAVADAGWVQRWFYKYKIEDRLNIMREHYLYDAEENAPFRLKDVESLFKQHNLEATWQEKIFGNYSYRMNIVKYLILILFLIYNPLI